ncbi:hypothetical protein M422DRAFT_81072, partial [Sphaerobolus stellatus SS14]
AEMVHISGATTAQEMWQQLTTVKESKGKLGILAARRALYRFQADESNFNMVDHISELRKRQEELHLLENKVSDEDFAMILLTSLPETWDQYTLSYLGSKGNALTLSSHELIGILLEEDRRRRSRSEEHSAGTAMQSNNRKFKNSRSEKSDKECFNCGKTGHVKKDCWSKGGGQEGKGPRGKRIKGSRKEQANQVEESVGNSFSFMAHNGSHDFSKYDWILDSGTTSHISTTQESFVDYKILNGATVKGIGAQPVPAVGRGSVIVKFTVDGNEKKLQLRDVLHVPSAPNCLLSISRLDNGGGKAEFSNGGCQLRNKNGEIFATGKNVNNLYLLDARADLPGESVNIATALKPSWDEWHRRYGHISINALDTLKRNRLVNGFTIDEASIPLRSCESCIKSKLAHRRFPPEAQNRSNVPGERLMSDVWGPSRVHSIHKSKYYISFTDDCTRMCHILFLKDKGQAFDKIVEYATMVEKKFGISPRFLRFDNGKELVNEKLKAWASQRGIIIETTAPYSPSQNGVAECFNRTLLELARAMLFEKKLPEFLWEEAVAHAAYLRNRAPTRALESKTPYEAWHGTKPNVSHLREFGS